MNCVLCNLFLSFVRNFVLSSNMHTQCILDYSHSLLGCLVHSCMIYRQTMFWYLKERDYFHILLGKVHYLTWATNELKAVLLSEGKQMLIPGLRLLFPSMTHVKACSSSLALTGRGTAGAHQPRVLKAWNKARFVCLQITPVFWHVLPNKCSTDWTVHSQDTETAVDVHVSHRLDTV